MEKTQAIEPPELISDQIYINESDERYQRLLDLLPDGVVLHVNGIVVLVNKATMAIMKVSSADELLGKQILSFIHPDYHEMAIIRQQKMLTSKEIALPIEELIIRNDGSQFYAETAGSVVTYKGMQAIQVVFRDVSERKIAYKK